MTDIPRPLLLIVMDGYGLNPRMDANAIALAINGLNNPAYRAPTDPQYFVRVCDDHGSTSLDAQKAAELVSDGYVAFITGGSGSTLAVSNVAAASGVPSSRPPQPPGPATAPRTPLPLLPLSHPPACRCAAPPSSCPGS